MSDIQLYNGDCLDVMDGLIAMGVKVDCVITDPPYLLETEGTGTTGVGCKKLNRNFIGIDINDKWVNVAKEQINAD